MSVPKQVVDAVVALAKARQVDAALLMAIVDVETSGAPFYASGNPTILCESHVFYARLPATLRAHAMALGLATPRQPRSYAEQSGGGPVREARLAAMATIDEAAAYESVSMGLGQILGENHEACGYASAKEMYVDFRTVEAQLEATYLLLDHMGALTDLERHDWVAAARKWNGPKEAVHGYDRKIAAAFARWSISFRSGQTSVADGTLGLGSKGPAVSAIQRHLVDTGYPVRVDGVYGPGTHRMVAAFQAQHGLPGTGVLDQATADKLVSTPAISHGARELATAQSLRGHSRIVDALHHAKNGHWAGAAAAPVVYGFANVDKVSSGLDYIQKVQDVSTRSHDLVLSPLMTVWAYVGANQVFCSKVAAVAVAAVMLAFFANHVVDRAVDARVDDERTGATT